MKSLPLVLAALALATSSPAFAWENHSDETVCRIAESWELGSFLIISKPTAPEGDNILGDLMSDSILISMQNDEWNSLKFNPGIDMFAEYTIRFEDEDGAWLENKPLIGDKMFFLITNISHLENFKYSTNMLITRDGKKVAQVDWSGFLGPFLQLKRCIDNARAPIIEQQRLERLRKETPVDPFAN